jgi:hypothetical protein
MTAAAFAKGLLDLEGELTPILVTLVSKDADATQMLDDSGKEHESRVQVKKRLKTVLNMNQDIGTDEVISTAAPTMRKSLVDAIRQIGNPRKVYLPSTTTHIHTHSLSIKFRS